MSSIAIASWATLRSKPWRAMNSSIESNSDSLRPSISTIRLSRIIKEGFGSFNPLNATKPSSGAGVAKPSKLTRCSFMNRKRPIGSLLVMRYKLA